MPVAISTGQITIIDQNDAKPISIYLAGSKSFQQVYTKNDSSASFVPDYTSSGGLVISPKISVGAIGSPTDYSTNTTVITNRRWGKSAGATDIYSGTLSQDATSFVSSNGGTAVASPFSISGDGISLTINGNLKDSIVNYPIYFEAIYTDPATSLQTKIMASAELNVIKTGTNAVYVTIRGKTVVEEATGSTKNNIAVCAELVRADGVDTSDLIYRWYRYDAGSPVQISKTTPASEQAYFGLTSTAVAAEVTTNNTTLGSYLGATTLPTAGTGTAYASGNTLVISEKGVNDIAVFKVEITDTAEAKTYKTNFTVYDFSDPYDVQIVSSTGDKLPNGTGSTVLSPKVYYGSNVISDLTGWTFTWTFYDRYGYKGAFVDPCKSGNSPGLALYNGGYGTEITSITGTSAPYELNWNTGTSTPLLTTLTNIIKVVKADGSAHFFEISGNPTTTKIALLAPASNSFIEKSQWQAPTGTNDSSFIGAKIFPCVLNAVRNTTGAGTITVTDQDVDVKTRITCEAFRPA